MKHSWFTAFILLVACASPPERAAIAPATGVRLAKLGVASPLDQSPVLTATVHPKPGCGEPIYGKIRPSGTGLFMWVLRAYDSRTSAGWRAQGKGADLWQEPTEPIWTSDGAIGPKVTYNGECVGTELTVDAQLAAAAVGSLAPVDYPMYIALKPLADPPWVTDAQTILDPTSFATAVPGAHAVVLHGHHLNTPPVGHALAPAFDGSDAAKVPLAISMNHEGRIVILDRGDRLVDIGHFGATPPKTLMLHSDTGGDLAPDDHLEKFAWGSHGLILATNRHALYRVSRISGQVFKVLTFPPAPLPAVAAGGPGPCCDVLHLSDVRAARGVFLVTQAGRPQVDVLDDVDFHLIASWTPAPIAGKPVIAIRQLAAAQSTGWVWLVAQTDAEPNYKSELQIYRYALPMSGGGPQVY